MTALVEVAEVTGHGPHVVEDEALAAMPAVVQESLIEMLAQLQRPSDPLDAVRLIAGTTVTLHDCMIAGTFSERLFYRLNIIHVVMRGCCATRHALNEGTPTRAEPQAAFVSNDHISEVRSE